METTNRFREGGIVALMFTKRQLEGRGRYWGASPSGNCCHIHIMVRTPNDNDYGKDLLRQHLERFHW